ncbi:MAG: ABC transporter substrate-binding protein [Thermoguttaceae bacterium]|nr:ABC transporter substrate-binding protein [Thermoguttaceae bacterium]
MNKTSLPAVLLALICVFICGCNTDQAPPVIENEVRVVSLSPNYTEIVYRLGAEDLLVGRSDACNYPPESQSVPIAGQYASPNWEKLYTLRPTVVLSADFIDDRIHKTLLSKGIDVYRNDPKTFDDLFEAIRQTGKRVQKEDEAKTLVESLQAQLKEISESREKRLKDKGVDPDAHKPRVLVVVWHNPLCIVGGNTFVAESVRLAGGVNLSDDLSQQYSNISPERLIGYSPDIILFPQMEAGVTADALLNYPGLESVPAIKNKRIITEIPGDIILRPGPRLVEGVKMLAEILSDESL